MAHPPAPTPRLVDDIGPIGGQALIEGVMMRRAGAWGAAVRRVDGTIATTGAPLPPDNVGLRRVPLVRGSIALVDSVRLGTRAMVWGAQARGTSDGKGYTRAGLAVAGTIAAVGAVALFAVLPATAPKLLGLEGRWAFSVAEGAVRLGVLVGYLGLLARSPQVRRTFEYHGAEHMTIHAFEHGAALDPASIRTFDWRHPRCGTSFLLLVVLVTLVAHAAVGDASWPVLVASRIVGLPLVAGIAYEAIRLAGRHRHHLVGRILTAPGSWLQALTTDGPDDDQIAVAVAALHATLAAEAQALPATRTPAAARA